MIIHVVKASVSADNSSFGGTRRREIGLPHAAQPPLAYPTPHACPPPPVYIRFAPPTVRRSAVDGGSLHAALSVVTAVFSDQLAAVEVQVDCRRPSRRSTDESNPDVLTNCDLIE